MLLKKVSQFLIERMKILNKKERKEKINSNNKIFTFINKKFLREFYKNFVDFSFTFSLSYRVFSLVFSFSLHSFRKIKIISQRGFHQNFYCVTERTSC